MVEAGDVVERLGEPLLDVLDLGHARLGVAPATVAAPGSKRASKSSTSSRVMSTLLRSASSM